MNIKNINISSSGKVLAVFVEGDGHDSISSIKSLFDTVAMMIININVQNAMVISG